MNGPMVPFGSTPYWKKLPKGARAMCKRCGVVSILRRQGRQFCGGCTKDKASRIRFRRAGNREIY